MSPTFTGLFTGRLVGIMEKDGYDRLGPSLTGRWFLVPFSDGDAGAHGADAADAAALLLRLADEVKGRNLMSATYPFTYVHTPDDPQMIKLYDPLACGSGCSSGSPMPWWVVSRVAPSADELASLRGAFAGADTPFWKKLIPWRA
ncbi:MAG: hypothetical protein HQK87_09235 [Nitrospinae bacterium]|nr:hypothetical protein [Nitrospinota bacterium]